MQAHRKLFIIWDGFPRSGVPQVTFFFPLKNVTVFILYVLACTHTMAYICEGQRFSSSACGSWGLDSGRRVWLARECLYSLSRLAGPQFSFLISCHKSSDLVFLENKRIFKHFTELKKIQCDMIPLIWVNEFSSKCYAFMLAQADSKIKSLWHDINRRKINYLFSLIGIWKNLQTSYEPIISPMLLCGVKFL